MYVCMGACLFLGEMIFTYKIDSVCGTENYWRFIDFFRPVGCLRLSCLRHK